MRGMLLALLCGWLVAGSVRIAAADTYTVANLSDSGAGSFRQAILDANAHSGADKIVFASGVAGTIPLTTELQTLSDDVEIAGPGADRITLTRATNVPVSAFRLLNVDSPAGAGPTVTLSGLTLSRGSSSGGGSGIRNVRGTVTLRGCLLSNNESVDLGGGIANAGTMVLIGCTFDTNEVIRSSASAVNNAGGGVYNTGDLSMTNCTFSSNSVVTGENMAGQSTSRGGGVYNAGTLHVSHCTFAYNAARLYYFIGILPSGHDPGQGGSIYNSGSLTIDDTIMIADTAPLFGGTLVNAGGTVVSEGYNLTNDGANGLLTGIGDQVSTVPILAPLQDNGGPTPTHNPLPAGPAIDAGNPTLSSTPATDQRGLPRVIGSRTDIGAVEYRPPFDFDGDGRNDLLFQNPQTGQIVAWYMNGLTVQGGIGLNYTPLPDWKVAGYGDFNGDGYPDLVFQHPTTKQVVVWFMRGSLYLGGELLVSPPANYTLVGVGDFSNDGKPDLVFEERTTGAFGADENHFVCWLMNRDKFNGATRLLGSVSQNNIKYRLVGVGDFNRDGKPDLLFQSDTDGQLVVWYMDERSYLGGSSLVKYPDSGWKVKAIADYNNDGWADIVFQNASTGKVVIWFMNGLSFAGGDYTTIQPLAPYQIAGPH